MFRANKIDVDGYIMWESNEGERLKQPDKKPKDFYGWHKVNVEGKIMWESPEGERVRNIS